MRRARTKLQVSTFPFLAVLLAAMGALILLLLVMDRRAKVVARNKVQEALQARKQDRAAKDAERLAAWQREQDEWHRQLQEHERGQEAMARRLAEQEKTLRSEVMKVQAELDTVAATLKKEELEALRFVQEQEGLRKWLAESSKNLEAHRRVGTLTKEHEEAATSTLAKMTAELARMEKILSDLKSRPKKDNVFSLVPYRGKHGENRRPIYVECGAAGVTFQPASRSLSIAEMDRARIRDEIRRCGLELVIEKEEPRDAPPRPMTAQKTDPYLLCLVRPDGVETYGRLLKALSGFDVDFGYELIDAHWELDFPSDHLAGAEPSPERTKPPRVVAGMPTSHPGTGGPGSGNPGTGNAGTGNPGTGQLQELAAQALAAQELAAQELVDRSGGPGMEGPGKAGTSFGTPGGKVGPGHPGTGAGKGPNPPTSPPGPGFPDGSPGPGSTLPGTRPETSLPPGKGPGTLPPGGLGGGTDRKVEPKELPKSKGPPREGTVEKSSGEPTTDEKKKDASGEVPWRGSKPPTPGEAGKRKGQPGENDGEPDDSEEGRPLPRDPLARASPRPPSLGHLLANRDFLIYIACTETDAIVKVTGQGFSTAGSPPEQTQSGQALAEAVHKLIARRQASLRPGEAPYRPMIRFQVYPGGLRTYYRIYPLLESLRVPMTRENIES